MIDLLGIGIGPVNLALAALASSVADLRTVFLDRRAEFRWHPGLMIEGATIQVPFLADLVSLVRPAHPLSFLSYLADQDRLFPFYFAERFHVDRVEYDAYCRWACERLPTCRFGHDVRCVDWSPEYRAFVVEFVADGRADRLLARNLVLGIGTEPHIPTALRAVAADRRVLHSADYLDRRAELANADEVVVVGSGQSGAEVFLDLLRRRPCGRERLHWLARTGAFAPMEYSKLGLEHFTPDYTKYFHGLPEPARDRLVAGQWQLHKGISAETMAEIHDELYRRSVHCGWPDVTMTPATEVAAARSSAAGIELDLVHPTGGGTLRADGVVLATGYAERPADDLLAPLAGRLRRDDAGRLAVGRDYRVPLDLPGSLYVQNAERHTHGVGAPDLGLGAWRAAVILNAIAGREVYRLPKRTAFTRFGLARSGASTMEEVR